MNQNNLFLGNSEFLKPVINANGKNVGLLRILVGRGSIEQANTIASLNASRSFVICNIIDACFVNKVDSSDLMPLLPLLIG